MLRLIRRHMRGMLAVIITAVLMLFFGMGSFFGGKTQATALKVGKREVSYVEYGEQYQRVTEFYRRQYAQNFSQIREYLNLEQQTIDSFISDVVLENYIEELGFGTSKAQLERKISESSLFKQLVTDKDSFQSYLQALGVSSYQLEGMTKKQVLKEQLDNTFRDLSFVSDVELKSIYKKEHKKAQFRYTSLPIENFESKVDTSDEEELKAYYEDNQLKYEVPKKVSFIAVEFAPKDFRSDVEITDEDLEISYNERKSEFYQPRKFNIQQIVLKKEVGQKAKLEEMFGVETSAEKDPNAFQSEISVNEVKLQEAKALHARLQGDEAEDFVTLAKEFSEEKDRIELGWLESSALDLKLKAAVDNLNPGGISDVVETGSAFYLVKVIEIEESRPKTLEEVKPQLEAGIRDLASPAYSYAAAENFYSEWTLADKSLTDYAAENEKIVIGPDKPISKNGSFQAAEPGLTSKVIIFPEGSKEFIELGDKVYVVEVTEVQDERIPEFADIKEELIFDFREERAKSLAREFAEESLEKLNADEPGLTIAKLAEENKLELVTTELKKFSEANDPVFNSPEIRQGAYFLNENNKVLDKLSEFSGKYYFLELLKTEEPSEEGFQEEREKLVENQKNFSQNRMLATLVSNLKSNSEIWVNPKLLQDNG